MATEEEEHQISARQAGSRRNRGPDEAEVGQDENMSASKVEENFHLFRWERLEYE